jgi:hypothetical protein
MSQDDTSNTLRLACLCTVVLFLFPVASPSDFPKMRSYILGKGLASRLLHVSFPASSRPRSRTFCSFADVGPDNRRRISYLTDVEGDRDYLTRYVEQSKVLCFRPCSSSHPLTADNLSFDFPYNHCMDFRRTQQPSQNDDCHLVYGGDVWDQGGSDLYVIRQLLHLKARYPDNVHIVMGNRDVNKMRLVQELRTDDDSLVRDTLGVYWLRGSGLVGDPERGEPLSRSPVERLRWILRWTMGSPRAFDHRKWELEQEQKGATTPRIITDEDVVRSYQQSSHPNGEMGYYLANATLALRLGQVLFVHGSLPMTPELLREGYKPDFWDDLTFAMPWLPKHVTARDMGVETIDDWLLALNNFGAHCVQAWRTGDPQKNGNVWSEVGGYDHSSQPYSQLIQYGMGWTPGRGRNPTVVYNRWCSNGMPTSFFPDEDPTFAKVTQDFFQRTGLSLICSGHQPQGDMPNSIRLALANRTSWIMSCDTSYSGDTTFLNLPGDAIQHKNRGRGQARSGRGMTAVSEVLIEQCTKSGRILDAYCHGTLSDGTKYRTQSLDFSDSESSSSSQKEKSLSLVVGELASGSGVPAEKDSPHGRPWWTRAAFVSDNGEDARSYLLTSGEGFESWNRLIEKR